MGEQGQREVRTAAAIGRCVLGAAGGFALWMLVLFLCSETRWWGWKAFDYVEWMFRLRVVAGFMFGGAVVGWLAGDHLFDRIAGRP